MIWTCCPSAVLLFYFLLLHVLAVCFLVIMTMICLSRKKLQCSIDNINFNSVAQKYGLVTRKSATFRPSRHVKMVWRVANFFVTSRQLVGRDGRVEFGERHDKRTNQQQTAGRPIM